MFKCDVCGISRAKHHIKYDGVDVCDNCYINYYDSCDVCGIKMQKQYFKYIAAICLCEKCIDKEVNFKK